MILNNNHATKLLLSTLKPIKKAIPTFFKSSVTAEAGDRWIFPSHKIVMRVSDDFDDYSEAETEAESVAEAMLRNPYVTISFTKLARLAPESVNEQTLREFITYLFENGFAPDDVQVALSPYNLSTRTQAGALNLVVIFDVAVYGQEEAHTASDATNDAPRKVNPLDYLTV